MKINEVEQLVGITKKNIRFYEAEGLLAPQRNSENGYRNYGDEDVEILRRIKLLRKLGVPIEEIRRIQSGRLTVADAMRRHQVAIDRDTENLRQARAVCGELAETGTSLEELDAAAVLGRMQQMEQEGTTFMNKQKNDVRRRYVAPVICTIIMALFMAAFIWLMLWGIASDPAGAPPMPIMALFIGIPGVVILGVVLALIQRLREIGKREEDDARRY